jgi:hypothetical protein
MSRDRKHERIPTETSILERPASELARSIAPGSPLYKLLKCIGCGCTMEAACPGGCSWIRIDPETALGICSRCTDLSLRLLELRWTAEFDGRVMGILG